VKGELPELPDQKRERFMTVLGLSPYDAGTLTASQEIAAYFEATVVVAGQPTPSPAPTGSWSIWLRD
jgi:aspartyl-tRNA(Asn)/glutamyl-tRNA(Gln) amidotransferase subunit B